MEIKMKQDNKPHKPNYNPNKEPSQGNPFQQQKPNPTINEKFTKCIC